MEKTAYTYEINGATYSLKPLVLGQIGQMTRLLQGIEITSDMGTKDLIETLGDRLPDAMAVLLTPLGMRIRDKDLDVIAGEMRENMDLATAMDVIEHFFSLNPIASIFERLAGALLTITDAVAGLRRRSSSSPGETSRAGTGSSGVTP